MTKLYEYVPHPHIQLRKKTGAVKIDDQRSRGNWYTKVNSRIAVWVTMGVGSMTCAWLFAILAIAGLPTALKPGNIGFLFWFSSDLLQLTLLSVIIVGQNIQARASDKRSEQTYLDAEAVLSEALKIQDHLASQDTAILEIQANLKQEGSKRQALSTHIDEQNVALKDHMDSRIAYGGLV